MKLLRDYFASCLHTGVPKTAEFLKVPKPTTDMHTLIKVNNHLARLNPQDKEIIMMKYAGDLHSIVAANKALKGSPIIPRPGVLLLSYSSQQIIDALRHYCVNALPTKNELESRIELIETRLILALNESISYDEIAT